ncbi:protein kinase [Spirillospora sp. NPDC052269]
MAEGEVTGPGTDVPLAGRYRLLSVLGRGGMGTVWRATDETLDREVAIKEIRLHPSLTDEERSTAYARMMREARASARLGHPAVVTVHDVVVHDDRPWLVMELVPSRSLQDIIDEDGPQPPQRVAALGRQLAGALRAAHAVGILHRDVKPANVLVTDDGRAVLTDFGIAQLSGDATLTRTGMVMGSPAYMAPERVKGEAAGPSSDVWALGATLYAGVEGKAPHHRSDAMAVLAAIMTLDAPPPRQAGALAPVLTAMLDRDDTRRPSIDQVEQELGRHATASSGPPTVRDAQVPVPPAWTAEPATRQVTPHAGGGGQPIPPQGATRQVSSQGATQQVLPQGGAPHGGAPQGSPQGGTQVVAAGGGGGTGKAVLLVVGGLAVLTILGAVGYNVFGRSGDAAGADPSPTQASSTAQKGDGGGHGASPVKPRPTGPPPGMTLQNVGGLRVAVPKGWKRQDARTFVDPATSSYVQVDNRHWEGDPTPEGHWKAWVRDPGTAQQLTGFNRLDQRPSRGRNGQPASDLEFTWIRNNELSHAQDRGFRKDGQPYAVIVVAPESRWTAMHPMLRQMLDSAG